jgi:oxygen-independent coproporphyrinogen-3 oxidase
VKDTTVYRERWEKQSPCISFGPRLHNYAADHFYESLEKHEDYIAALEAGKLPIRSIYPLSPQKQLIWYVLAQWKSNSPIIQSVIIQRFGENLHDWFMKLIQHYLTWGVLNASEDKIRVNEAYHYILEWILLELIEALK